MTDDPSPFSTWNKASVLAAAEAVRAFGAESVAEHILDINGIRPVHLEVPEADGGFADFDREALARLTGWREKRA